MQAAQNIAPTSTSPGFVAEVTGWFTRNIGGIVKYMMGKGIVSLSVMATTWVAGSVSWPIALGFLAWRGYREYERYTGYQKEMLETYREEIAQKMGVHPQEVTVGHLKKLAKGDPLLGLPENAIIAEALERQRSISWVAVITSTIAAAATFGLLAWGYGDKVGDWLKDIFPEYGEKIQKIGTSVVSGISGLILHNGLEIGIGQTLGHFRPTVHDRIVNITRLRGRGHAIAPEQVFDVLLAANPKLEAQVHKAFNKGFLLFRNGEKQAAMEAIGVRELMQDIADAINNGQMSAASLVFTIDTSHIESTLKQHKKDKSKEKEQEQAVSHPRDKEPALSTSTQFRDRVGHSPRSQKGSFVEAELVRREQATGLQHTAGV